MPIRSLPFINNSIYHVYNKSIDSKKVFQANSVAASFYDRLLYYRSEKSTLSFSQVAFHGEKSSQKILDEVLQKKYFMVRVLAYCLMPTHFHLLVMQNKDNGVTNFMSRVSNSFTKHYNLINKRNGQVFLKDFKAVLINSENQLLHTSRYIHLNPYTGGLVKKMGDLCEYRWSSYRKYVEDFPDQLVSDEMILGTFDGNRDSYRKFVYDNAEYQKSLGYLKYIE